ncbi:MAG: glycosyltransferase, partial [Candidatus Paceibacterota bacterium]
MKKLAILTVNYNNYRVTEDLLQSLVKQKDKNFKVYIADLSDKKKKISRNTRVLRNFSEVGFTDVVVGENKGYASGVNLALKQAVKQGFERFIVINNDTEVASDFTNAVSASLDKNPESVLGGKIYYFSGYEYHAKRYKKSDLGKVLWYAGGIMDWDNAYTRHRGVDEVDSGQ